MPTATQLLLPSASQLIFVECEALSMLTRSGLRRYTMARAADDVRLGLLKGLGMALRFCGDALAGHKTDRAFTSCKAYSMSCASVFCGSRRRVRDPTQAKKLTKTARQMEKDLRIICLNILKELEEQLRSAMKPLCLLSLAVLAPRQQRS